MREQEYYENINFIESLLRKYDEDLEEHIMIISSEIKLHEDEKEKCKEFDYYINNNIFLKHDI